MRKQSDDASRAYEADPILESTVAYKQAALNAIAYLMKVHETSVLRQSTEANIGSALARLQCVTSQDADIY